LAIPEVALPDWLDRVDVATTSHLRFPKADPLLKRLGRVSIRSTKEVNVIRHNDVAPDQIIVCDFECVANARVHGFVGEHSLSIFGADCDEDEIGSVELFVYRQVHGSFATGMLFRIHISKMFNRTISRKRNGGTRSARPPRRACTWSEWSVATGHSRTRRARPSINHAKRFVLIRLGKAIRPPSEWSVATGHS
jgi:hypothetical protein